VEEPAPADEQQHTWEKHAASPPKPLQPSGVTVSHVLAVLHHNDNRGDPLFVSTTLTRALKNVDPALPLSNVISPWTRYEIKERFKLAINAGGLEMYVNAALDRVHKALLMTPPALRERKSRA
jgi:hypothetical protein